MNIKIIGSGSYIPAVKVHNSYFLQHDFLTEKGEKFPYPNKILIEKFRNITGIEERRYAEAEMVASDLAYFASKDAIREAKIDPETLDYIIVAHNFGDVKTNGGPLDMMPSLATRVKAKLQIRNPKCVGYDILYGCPGWIEGMLQANAFIKSGMAKRCLVVGAETLSRVLDPHDRDSMIYADGAGATVVEACDEKDGMLSYESATFSLDESTYLHCGDSYSKDASDGKKYIKMNGRKIYEFAIGQVPPAMKSCLDKGGISPQDIKKILIHQANEKMDEAIVDRFYKLYDLDMPEAIMPMSIKLLGNSSVATIPTLFDLLVKNRLPHHELRKGDLLLFASVGAGMNINSFTYKY